MRVLGICGSLRAGSYNRQLLATAAEMAPQGMTIEIWDRLRDMPHYDADVEALGWPDAVAELKQKISAADALLFATPEYNYGMPGVLKNAIDWVAHPPEVTPLRGKPGAILGASTGIGGTIRAQLDLRQCLQSTGTWVMLYPEIFIQRCADKFAD